MTYDDKRKDILNAIDTLFAAGVISPSGHANLSVRVDADRMLLTNTGMVRGLRADQMAAVTLTGEVVDGELTSTNAEIVPMHAEVYRARPDINAVVHTHSPHATAFALAHHPLPCRYEALLRFGQAEDVPVVRWAPRGSDQSVRDIVTILTERHPQTSVVLLANHGLLAFGPTPAAASAVVIAVEGAAAAELGALPLGGAKDFPPGALEQVRRSMGSVR